MPELHENLNHANQRITFLTTKLKALENNNPYCHKEMALMKKDLKCLVMLKELIEKRLALASKE